MTPEQENNLIEKIAEEIFLDEQAKSPAKANLALFGTICGITWEQANSPDYHQLFANKARNSARAALFIAMPIIRDEALSNAVLVCGPKEDEAWSRDMVLGGILISNRIDALKSKGQKP